MVAVIDRFVEEVERRAEQAMLKTGKLEGAHYAAMKQLQAEYHETKPHTERHDNGTGR
jgi:hypothetical protein